MKAHTQFTDRSVKSILGVVLVLTLGVAAPAFAQQTAERLIQSGLYQEEVKGDLDEAIKVYEGNLKDFPKNRPIAATALLHIGLCYEKLGETEAWIHYPRSMATSRRLWPRPASALRIWGSGRTARP